MGSNQPATFSFGENWQSYIKTINQASVESSHADIDNWLGANTISGKKVLDIGCGSGIHSLVFFMLGAAEVVSFDVDPKSVQATKILWTNAGRPANWKIIEGSILDNEFVANLGSVYDIVYSWGVLHHTGALWEAIQNACRLPKIGGFLWIAIYIKGPTYPIHLALKQKYNRSSLLGKKKMIAKEIMLIMRKRLRKHQNPLKWNQKHARGMNVYHDLIDWLGGLPYEVASLKEVKDFVLPKGYTAEKIFEGHEGGNNIYLFLRTG